MSFSSFQQLHDVLSEQSKKLVIQLDIAKLTDDTITNLKDIINNHNGTKNLIFEIHELKDKQKLTMSSKAFKVAIDNELLEKLEAQSIHYKLN